MIGLVLATYLSYFRFVSKAVGGVEKGEVGGNVQSLQVMVRTNPFRGFHALSLVAPYMEICLIILI
jgi:hypothetical protein